MSCLNLEGRVVFVTGSTRGIGWATAKKMAEHGAAVVINGHSSKEILNRRVIEIRETYGVEAIGIFADMGDQVLVDKCYKQIFNTFRRLDVAVNNAGVLNDVLLGMITPDIIEKVLAVNTKGVLTSVQAASRLMRRNKRGSIINIGSIVGTRGNIGQVVYSASKAAVIGITRSAAKELAPYKIRVNAVAPGFIDTDMVRQLPDEVFKQHVDSIAMGRIGTPEDVARVILFLASDLSEYVTGQIVGVDGGMLI